MWDRYLQICTVWPSPAPHKNSHHGRLTWCLGSFEGFFASADIWLVSVPKSLVVLIPRSAAVLTDVLWWAGLLLCAPRSCSVAWAVAYRAHRSQSKSAHGSNVHFKWNTLNSSLNHSVWMFHLERRTRVLLATEAAAGLELWSNCLLLTRTERCVQQEEVAGLLQCLRVGGELVKPEAFTSCARREIVHSKSRSSYILPTLSASRGHCRAADQGVGRAFLRCQPKWEHQLARCLLGISHGLMTGAVVPRLPVLTVPSLRYLILYIIYCIGEILGSQFRAALASLPESCVWRAEF